MDGVRILIVEDEVIIADGLLDSLEEMGYEPLEPASSYEEAVELLENSGIDLAILDIHLPGSKTGIELGMLVRERYDLPVIFLTSKTDEVIFEMAKQANPSAFLHKPYNDKDLHNAIELALHNFSMPKEAPINHDSLLVKDALFIKRKQHYVRVELKDILYLKSDNIYLDIFTVDNNAYTVRGTQNEFLSRLGDDFFRCHRSFSINLNHLSSFDNDKVIIGKESLPVGEKYLKELKNRLNIA